MFLRLYLLFTTLLVANIQLANNSTILPDLKTIISNTISFRADGKIDIPKHIKHVKLDIGLSYHAPMSQYWLTHEDNLMVFGFEPNPSSVHSIINQLAPTNYLEKKFIGKKFFLIPCALGLSSSKIIKFFITANDCGCSSIYIPQYFKVKDIIEVPIFPLSDFFDLFPFDTHPIIDYIKIDAQGADLDIVKSAGHYLAEKVIYITLEAEDSQYQNTVNSLEAIEKYMHNIGFIRYNSPFTNDPTYFNFRFTDYIKTHHIQIYQS